MKKAEVFLDPGYMKEVFRNIFCNAMEAMEESRREKKVFVELKIYDEEVEMTTQSILAAMEPLIIVFMALIVGTLVIAVILPIGVMYFKAVKRNQWILCEKHLNTRLGTA